MTRARRRAVVVALTLAAVLIAPASAGARFATGGTGTFVSSIEWPEWGVPFAWIGASPSITRTSTTTVGGVDLVVSCTLSNFGGVESPIRPGAYRAGDWPGDALDDLYNIGGAGLSNELVNGIFGENVPPATTVATMNFSCGATLGGAPLALRGVVFADAEQATAAEYGEASVAAGATWRVIERVRTAGCASTTLGTRTETLASTTLRLAGDGTTCATGPAVVAFADGATSGAIALLGGGKTAFALGVMVAFDRGDAPGGYGEAVHAVLPAFSDGVPPAAGPSSMFDVPVATVVAPPTRLGASATDDSEAPSASIAVWPGTTFTRSAIACTGPGTVAGWIDFDGSGTFDGGERSASAPCSGSSVDLSWTVPAGARAQAASVMRLRIAGAAGEVAEPAGVARSGEVEDHALAIALVPPAGPTASTAAALTVVNTADRTAVSANGRITWTVTVTNRAGRDATGVALVDEPSLPVTFERASATAGGCAKAASVRCDLGTLAPGASVTVTVAGRARVAGSLRSSARASADNADPAAATATTDVRGTLRVRKSPDRSSVLAGGRVRYVLRMSNPSLVAVRGVRVCDRLPRGLVLVSASRTVVRRGAGVCWNLGTLARRSSTTVRIVTRARRGAGRPVTNRATVSGSGAVARTVASRPVRVVG